jgi:hypothetical protein
MKAFRIGAAVLACLALLLGFYVPDLAAGVALATMPVVGSGFGQPVNALTMRQVLSDATPPGWNPNDQENIWYDWYDTQVIASAAVINAEFFQALPAGNDRSLSNMKIGGQLPSPYSLRIYNINVDLCPIQTSEQISTAAVADLGVLNDHAKIMSGGLTRWQLTVDDKEYGPHRLSLLHGTGGARGFGYSSDGAEIGQFGFNDSSPGWNYFGSVTIPTQTPFRFLVQSSATVGALVLSRSHFMTVHLQGVIGRGAR